MKRFLFFASILCAAFTSGLIIMGCAEEKDSSPAAIQGEQDDTPDDPDELDTQTIQGIATVDTGAVERVNPSNPVLRPVVFFVEQMNDFLWNGGYDIEDDKITKSGATYDFDDIPSLSEDELLFGSGNGPDNTTIAGGQIIMHRGDPYLFGPYQDGVVGRGDSILRLDLATGWEHLSTSVKFDQEKQEGYLFSFPRDDGNGGKEMVAHVLTVDSSGDVNLYEFDPGGWIHLTGQASDPIPSGGRAIHIGNELVILGGKSHGTGGTSDHDGQTVVELDSTLASPAGGLIVDQMDDAPAGLSSASLSDKGDNADWQVLFAGDGQVQFYDQAEGAIHVWGVGSDTLTKINSSPFEKGTVVLVANDGRAVSSNGPAEYQGKSLAVLEKTGLVFTVEKHT